jgi:hypothetical protein
MRPALQGLIGVSIMVAANTAASPARADIAKGIEAYGQGLFEIALTEFQSEAEVGSKEAQFYLANMFFAGQGVDQSYGSAARYYELAAMQGHTDAQLALATMYRAGQGVSKDYLKVLFWLEEAAIAGHPVAQLDLGDIFETGENGAAIPNYEYAFRWYSLAANNGIANAQAKVGQMYLVGRGIEQDQVKGLMWLIVAERHAEGEEAEQVAALQQEFSADLTKEVVSEAKSLAKKWAPEKIN